MRKYGFAGISLLVAAGFATWYFDGAPNWINSEKNRLSAETKRVLESGETFVLFSLHPTHPEFRLESERQPDETFHEFEVLGKAKIRDPAQRAELLKSLYRGIAKSDGRVAGCFNPRHGISATLGDETVDLVICFECLSIRTYSKHDSGVLTTASPKQTFDRALKRANLPLPKE